LGRSHLAGRETFGTPKRGQGRREKGDAKRTEREHWWTLRPAAQKKKRKRDLKKKSMTQLKRGKGRGDTHETLTRKLMVLPREDREIEEQTWQVSFRKIVEQDRIWWEGKTNGKGSWEGKGLETPRKL